MIKTIERKIKTVINNPKSVGVKFLQKISPLLDDERYLKLLFPLKTGYKLNLNNPQTYNEKLQWLKLYYRDPKLVQLVDKYEAKTFIKNTIGEEYVVKNYGIWESFDDIDFNTLPNQFVLKTTHDQGGVIICEEKNDFNFKTAEKKLNKHLKFKHFYLSREWPYKQVKPRILAERLLIDNTKDDIWDYKFYCFHGEPKIMYISMGRRQGEVPLYFYDMDFNSLNIERPKYKSGKLDIEKPVFWNEMISLSRKLSKNLPHIRVDFYYINNKIYVGELTLFQGGGLMPFYPKEWDYILGDFLILPDQKK